MCLVIWHRNAKGSTPRLSDRWHQLIDMQPYQTRKTSEARAKGLQGCFSALHQLPQSSSDPPLKSGRALQIGSESGGEAVELEPWSLGTQTCRDAGAGGKAVPRLLAGRDEREEQERQEEEKGRKRENKMEEETSRS